MSNKKPHPEIYTTAAARLGLPPSSCVVVEDSLVGLRAAVGAGTRCVITYTPQTAAEDFYAEGAEAKLLDFGECAAGASAFFDAEGTVLDELLVAERDPKEEAAAPPAAVPELPTGAYEYAAAQEMY